jgi:hypothetical protein
MIISLLNHAFGDQQLTVRAVGCDLLSPDGFILGPELTS